ncbi:MAG TPA: four helix bundle protein [Bacteroidetes bacterium]|nr:four helix bundle protein [Bacteroidota bacterium]
MAGFKDLVVYQKAFDLAMEIFEISKGFPREERYALVSQIRRSSRSVCSNLAEGYRKHRYSAHFVSKVSDADMENSETQVWIDFAHACGYIDEATRDRLTKTTEEIGRLLNDMLRHPRKYVGN